MLAMPCTGTATRYLKQSLPQIDYNEIEAQLLGRECRPSVDSHVLRLWAVLQYTLPSCLLLPGPSKIFRQIDKKIMFPEQYIFSYTYFGGFTTVRSKYVLKYKLLQFEACSIFQIVTFFNHNFKNK